MIVNRFDKIYYALIGVIALLIVVLYSYSTSFIYDKPALGDAAIFILVKHGQMALNRMLIYGIQKVLLFSNKKGMGKIKVSSIFISLEA